MGSSVLVEGLTDIPFDLQKSQPAIFLCLEGPNFQPTSVPVALSVLVLDPAGERHCHLIRIDQLGSNAFDMRGRNGLSLRDVLQRQDFPKTVFDLPTTARSLYSMYGIALRGVLDLQIMGTVTRRLSRGSYHHHADDLVTCIRLDCPQPSERVDQWEESRSMDDPHPLLTQHSVSMRAKEYILAGVVGLPILTYTYLRRMRNSGVQNDWKEAVAAETRERVRHAQGGFAEGKDLEGVDYPLLYEDDLLERLEKLMGG